MEFEMPNMDSKKSKVKKAVVGALVVGSLAMAATEKASSVAEEENDDKIELSNIKATNEYDSQGVEHNINMFEADVPEGIEKIYVYPGNGSRQEIIIRDGKFEFPGMGVNITGVDKDGGEHYLTFEQ